MKKVLLSAVAAFGLFGAVESSAVTITPATQGGAIGSHVILDTRPVVNLAQQTMLQAAPAVATVLRRAEDLGYGNYDTISIEEGSFAGLDDNNAISVSSNAITFTFDATEIQAKTGLSTWTAVYTPVLGQGNSIDGWSCSSNATAQPLGSNFITPAANELDPVTKGLGWPYAGCTVA